MIANESVVLVVGVPDSGERVMSVLKRSCHKLVCGQHSALCSGSHGVR
jgi:hypothetical protein